MIDPWVIVVFLLAYVIALWWVVGAITGAVVWSNHKREWGNAPHFWRWVLVGPFLGTYIHLHERDYDGPAWRWLSEKVPER